MCHVLLFYFFRVGLCSRLHACRFQPPGSHAACFCGSFVVGIGRRVLVCGCPDRFALRELQLGATAPGHQCPSVRDGASIAYDELSSQTLLFGGYDGSSFPSDTWLWTGTNWQLAARLGPSPRYASSMAYDTATGYIVLFGGSDASGVGFSDTWLWDGLRWIQQSPATSPPGRYFATMGKDGAGNVLLFGGVNSSGGRLSDTWLWNGTTWSQRFPGTSPEARSAAVIAFDSTNGNLVLFGGKRAAAAQTFPIPGHGKRAFGHRCLRLALQDATMRRWRIR